MLAFGCQRPKPEAPLDAGNDLARSLQADAGRVQVWAVGSPTFWGGHAQGHRGMFAGDRSVPFCGPATVGLVYLYDGFKPGSLMGRCSQINLARAGVAPYREVA